MDANVLWARNDGCARPIVLSHCRFRNAILISIIITVRIYTGVSHKKTERWIFSTLRAESCHIDFLHHCIKYLPQKRMIPKSFNFGWVILILCPFLEIRSFSNFARHLRPMSEELCREWPFIVVLCGMPIDQNKRNTVST